MLALSIIADLEAIGGAAAPGHSPPPGVGPRGPRTAKHSQAISNGHRARRLDVPPIPSAAEPFDVAAPVRYLSPGTRDRVRARLGIAP